MGLLDSIVGAALNNMGGGGAAGGGQGNAQLIQLILGMLAGNGQGGAAAGGGLGGLGGLLEQFQRNGLGEVANSWVSTGQNLPISPEQLGQVFGNERVGGMASQLGMNPQDLLGQLSQMLPQVVDQLTPQGRVPDQLDVGGLDLGGLLGGLLRR